MARRFPEGKVRHDDLQYRVIGKARQAEILRQRELARRKAKKFATVKHHERMIVSKLSDPFLFDEHMKGVSLAMMIRRNARMPKYGHVRHAALSAIILMMDELSIDVFEIRDFKK